LSTREKQMYGVKREHKNILDMIDSIKLVAHGDGQADNNGCTVMMLDWNKFKVFEKKVSETSKDFDMHMLTALMQTNIADYLSRLPFLKVVPSSKLEILASMCHYSLGKVDEVICKEGDIGDKVFMILSGNVKVEATAHADKPATDNKRPARRGSVVKVGAGAKSADQFTSKKAQAKRITLNGMKQVGTMGANMMNKITENGSEGRLSGESEEPSVAADGSFQIELAQLHDGEYFGEMAAFIELPRAATVTATQNCLFATLSKSDFRSFIKVVPNIENSIEFMVRQHMLQNLIQLKSPFLEQITLAKSHNMASKSCIEIFKKDDKIFQEGDAAEKVSTHTHARASEASVVSLTSSTCTHIACTHSRLVPPPCARSHARAPRTTLPPCARLTHRPGSSTSFTREA